MDRYILLVWSGAQIEDVPPFFFFSFFCLFFLCVAASIAICGLDNRPYLHVSIVELIRLFVYPGIRSQIESASVSIGSESEPAWAGLFFTLIRGTPHLA